MEKMEEMTVKYEVIKAFRDKETKRVYRPGDVYETEDKERVSALQKQAFIAVEEIPEESEKEPETEEGEKEAKAEEKSATKAKAKDTAKAKTEEEPKAGEVKDGKES